MLKTFEVKLDVEKELYTSSEILFSVSRNDFDSIELLFEIIQDGEPFDLTGKTIELAVLKPSGTAVYQDCTITDVLGGKASARLSIQAYVDFGVHSAELNIRDAEQMVVTSPFYYKSREGILGTEEIESTNDWSAIQKALFLYDLKPILTEGAPTVIPEYVGQTALDTLNNVFYIANGTLAESWVAIIQTDGGTGTTVSWTDILNKPLEFPPESHIHEILDVNGLQLALDGKVDDSEMAGKSDVGHVHDFGEIANKPLTYPPDAHSHDFASITDKPLTYPPDVHNHAIADVTGLQGELDSKVDDAEIGGLDKKPILGTVAPTTVVPEYVGQMYLDTTTNNAYISNGTTSGAFVPIDTPDDWADITGKPATFPPDAHNHAIADVTNLQASLDAKVDDTEMAGKSDVGHKHDFTADITGKPATYPPDAHSHEIADITGLQTGLDAKDEKPLLGAGAPTTITPAYVGQMYLNTTTNETYISTGTTSGAFVLVNPNESVEWGEVSGTLANQTDLKTALDGKSDNGHAHTFAEITEKPATYPPDAHSHDFTTEITGKPATYPPPLADSTTVGGHRVGNGLTMVGEYLTVRSGTGLLTDGATSYAVEIDRAQTDAWYVQNASGMDLTLWKGTQTEYDAITTKDPNTVYFIV